MQKTGGPDVAFNMFLADELQTMHELLTEIQSTLQVLASTCRPVVLYCAESNKAQVKSPTAEVAETLVSAGDQVSV